MQKEKPYQLLLVAFLSLYFHSCIPQHKVAVTKKQLSQQDSLLQVYDHQLDQLEVKRKEKEALNETDDTANTRIRQYFEKTRAEISELHQENTILIGTVEIKKEDWDRLKKNLSTCLNATKIVVYCSGGNCEDSEFAALTLKEAGAPLDRIAVYAGGITDWTAKGLPIEVGARNSGNLRPANP